MPIVIPKLRSLRVLAAGHERAERVDGVHRLAPALDLAARQVVGVGAVDPGQMDEVQVGQVALVGDGAPGPASVMRSFGIDTGLDRLLEGLAKERREQLVLLAGGLDVPFARCPPSPDRSAGRP